MNKTSRSAFTLVELAIVITIIGLLIGGVLKGQELLENARMTATQSQVKGYSTAITAFKDIYKQLPGDFANAQNFLQNCTAGVQCTNGNGDGKVGPTTDYYNLGVVDDMGMENLSFWKHLALANLITGIDATATTNAPGKSHTVVPMGGVFHALSFDNYSALFAPFSGTVITLKKSVDGTWTGSDALTPSTALKLDLKMDDGVSFRGDVQSVSNAWTNGCGEASNATIGYNVAVTSKTCEMVFNLQ